MKRALFVMVLAITVCLSILACRASADGNSLVFYRIGEDAPQQWAFVKQYFEGKGYPVSIYQGEAVVEKHIEKVNMINRSPAKVFLALQLVKGDSDRVMVAMTDAKKEEGRFLTIDEIPGLFAEESQRLATDIAGPFKVKVKHLPALPAPRRHYAGGLRPDRLQGRETWRTRSPSFARRRGDILRKGWQNEG